VFALVSAAYFLVYFHRLAPAVVAVDLMRDLSASGPLMGLLASAYFYPYALMQIPTGLLSDSVGPRKTICACLALAGLGSLLFIPAQGAGLAVAARALVGLGVSTAFVCGLKLFTRWFKPSEFAATTALFLSVGASGALCAGAPLSWLSASLGWRAAFGLIGVATLGVTVALWRVVRDDPRDMDPAPAAASAGPAPGPSAYPNAGREQIGASARAMPLAKVLRQVAGTANFWPCGLWMFGMSGVYFSLGGLWGGPYLRHVAGMDAHGSGLILSLMSLGMLLGAPVMGRLSDRVFQARRPMLLGQALLVAGMFGVLAVFPDGLGVTGLSVWFFLFGMVAGSGPVAAFSAVKEMFPLSMAGTALGLTNLFPFLGGAGLQFASGVILEAHGRAGDAFTPKGYAAMFALHAAVMLAAAGCAWVFRETFPPSLRSFSS
jgi:sugar phosphate permease